MVNQPLLGSGGQEEVGGCSGFAEEGVDRISVKKKRKTFTAKKSSKFVTQKKGKDTEGLTEKQVEESLERNKGTCDKDCGNCQKNILSY